jgi:serine/threonine protein kinase
MENLNTSQLNEQIKNLPPSKKLRKKQLIVGRYEVVHTLAGGMGIVYLCRDHLESRLVALKTFKPEFLSHVGARDLFLREGTMWVEIGRHPHIVRAHRVERTADGLEVYLVLNWVLQPPGKDNPSLRAWLKPGQPLPVKLALTFALHIARGMKYATGQIAGLVHRDLKPENVLIGHDGNARVTDFGLASTWSEMNLGNRITSLPNSRENFGRTQLTQGIAGTPR